MARRPLLSALILFAAGGCATIGPEYRAPVPAPLASAGTAFVTGAPSSAPRLARWWTALSDPDLDALIGEALVENRDLAVARGRVLQAMAELEGERARGRPSAEARATIERNRPSFAPLGVESLELEAQDFTLYDVGLSASWELDLFGGHVRAVERASARLEAADASLADVQVSVVGQVVQAYVSLRAAEAGLVIVDREIGLRAQLLDLVRRRVDLGAASALDRERAAAQLALARGRRPVLEAEVISARARLAALSGRELAALSVPESAVGVPAPPSAFGVGDPAEVIRRRPDVRAAERRLAAETAGIGVVAAELFPRVSLLGRGGYQTSALSDFGQEGFTFGLGPVLTWSFADAGRVRARIALQRGVREEALALYERAVISALADAESALARHLRTRDEVERLEEAAERAAQGRRFTEARYRLGVASLIEVLDAQAVEFEAERRLLDASARAAASYAALSTALGLGWD